ncbi:MAG: hypothetical protein GVY13_00130 [Alphaproteobacteria bacterium]|jgi:hypothetical protein|nr:hypothetical protein [Alphaproteobacteria bacterium]
MPIVPSFNVSVTPDFVEMIEGTDTVTHLVFTVTRGTRFSSEPGFDEELVSFEVVPTGDNPVDADDFADGVLPSGTLEFSYSETTRLLSFALNNDTVAEADETFSVSVNRGIDVSGFPAAHTLTATADVTILDDDGIDLSGPTVFRFFNTETGVHLYTADTEEVAIIQDTAPQFQFEGGLFRGASDRNEDAIDVFRFFNTESGTHFYTSNEDEAAFVEENLETFVSEDVAFRAFDRASAENVPVYRFFNTETGAHFFTADESERSFVESVLDEYVSEGIAFYVDPLIG